MSSKLITHLDGYFGEAGGYGTWSFACLLLPAVAGALASFGHLAQVECDNRRGAFPTLVKCLEVNIDNHMAHWKVIALVNGQIETVSGPAAQDRPPSPGSQDVDQPHHRQRFLLAVSR